MEKSEKYRKFTFVIMLMLIIPFLGSAQENTQKVEKKSYSLESMPKDTTFCKKQTTFQVLTIEKVIDQNVNETPNTIELEKINNDESLFKVYDSELQLKLEPEKVKTNVENTKMPLNSDGKEKDIKKHNPQ